jgi:predicted aspartyl protease
MAAILPGIAMASLKKPLVTEVSRVSDLVSIAAIPILDGQGNTLGATIPLKRAGRLFVMEGTVNGVSGNFILDTGSSRLVLNKTYFRSSIVAEDEEGGGVTGATESVERIHVVKMAVSDMVFSNVIADVTPLGHLEDRRGIKILGLFGMSLLQQMEMVIDLKNNELQLFRIDKSGLRPGQQAAEVKFDIVSSVKIVRKVLFIKAQMGGKELDFCLDTGAESNLLHTGCPKQAMEKVNITRRSSLRGAGPRQGEILMGTITDLQIGNRQFGPMETAVCSLNGMSAKYGYPIDGMLGYDFFMQGRFFINLIKKTMSISLRQEEKL